MVKIIFSMLILVSGLFSQNIYERHCVSCHKTLPVSLQKIFMDYLLVYGGEKNMKAGIKHYLKYPIKDISVMSDLFIERYGIKKRTELSDKELDEAIDIYWNRFKVFKKLH